MGSPGRVDIYSSTGNPQGSFTVGETGQPAGITAIKAFGKEVIVADASAKIIRRYDRSGKHLGAIGAHGKITGFIIPNHSLDIDVDAKGNIYATDSGRHRVTSWSVEGSLKGNFGKFGLKNPEDFVGCCNPRSPRTGARGQCPPEVSNRQTQFSRTLLRNLCFRWKRR